MALPQMHILSKAAARLEPVGFSLNYSDDALDLIADEVDWDAGSLMLWLTATGKLDELKQEPDEEDGEEDADNGHLPEPANEPDDGADDEQDAED